MHDMKGGRARSTAWRMSAKRRVKRVLRTALPNSSRQYLLDYNRAFAATFSSDMVVLDAGSGTQPYRHLFNHCHYESADFEAVDKVYAPSTHVCDLAQIPVEAARYDGIICNQVLEHLPDPSAVLAELHRVLKPGGRLLCTCPLFYEEHEQPYDFYRYTRFAHEHLFETAGFEIVRIEWMEGFFGTVAYALDVVWKYLPVNLLPRASGASGAQVLALALAPLLAAVKLSVFGLAALFYRLDRVYKVTDRGFPKNYAVFALKPGAPVERHGP